MPRGSARSTLLALVCGGWAVLGGPSAARAADAPLPVRLEFTGVQGCASARDMVGAIQRRNGRVRLAAKAERATTLVVTVRAEGDALRGELQVRADDGTTKSRSVTGATCQAVVEALSLTAALALETVAPTGATPTPASSGTAGEASQPPPGTPAAAPAAATTPDATTPVATAPGPRRSVSAPSVAGARAPLGSAAPGATGSPGASSHLKVEAGAQASFGQMVAPHLNAGGALLARARFERGRAFSPSLTLSVLHTRNELFDSGRRADMRLTGLSLAACPMTWRPVSRLRFEPCVAASGARLSATGRDVQQPETATRSWWGLGALARLSLSVVTDLAVEVEGGALVPLADRRFVVMPSGRELGRTPALAPFATAGVAYAL